MVHTTFIICIYKNHSCHTWGKLNALHCWIQGKPTYLLPLLGHGMMNDNRTGDKHKKWIKKQKNGGK
jgi:hypothetical protein